MVERKETKLWTSIREGTKKCSVHWTRIENLVDSGTPDTWGVSNGKYFPVELKIAMPDGFVYMRPAQVNWMLMHEKCGGKPWIVVRWLDLLLAIPFTNKLYKVLEQKQNGKYLCFNLETIYANAMYEFISTKPFDYKRLLDVLCSY